MTWPERLPPENRVFQGHAEDADQDEEDVLAGGCAVRAGAGRRGG